MIWTRRTVALTALGTVLGSGVLGGGAAYAMTSGHSQAATPAAIRTVQPSGSPRTTQPATPGPAPTRTVYVAPQAPAPTAYVTVPAYTAPSQIVNAEAVVTQYYADLSSQDYAEAWNLGGSNVSNGVGYDAWVAGYATTDSISLGTFSNWGSDTVQVDVTAVQSDGSVNTYNGSYTVQNGVIISANIVQTG